MEKMRMESLDMTTQNIEKIGALFPNCITETVDENGNITMTILFAPTENGTVFLSEGTTLAPMTLYAIFE